MTFTRKIAGVAIGLALFLSALQASASNNPAPADLTEFFRAVALGSNAQARLVKWQFAPIVRLETYKADDTAGERGLKRVQTSKAHYESVQLFVRELKELTGLSVRLLPRDMASGGDITISMVPRTHMRVLRFEGVPERVLRAASGPGRCFFLIWPSASWSIRKAHIVINKRLEENHINHCFIEELSQSLGLPHDSRLLSPTIFSEAEKLNALSPIDRVLIRALYDPRVKAGSNWSDLEPVIPSVISGAMQ